MHQDAEAQGADCLKDPDQEGCGPRPGRGLGAPPSFSRPALLSFGSGSRRFLVSYQGFKSHPSTENVSKGRRKGQASEFFIFAQDWKIPGFPTVYGIYSQKGQAGPRGVRCPEGSDSTVPFSSTPCPGVSPLQGGAGSLGNQGLRSGNKGSVGRSGDTPALSLGDRPGWALDPGTRPPADPPDQVGGGLCCEVWKSGGMPARTGRALGSSPAALLGVGQARGGNGLGGRRGAW